MSRYFLKIKYDGTGYSGWQIQPNDKTVQQELNKALKKLNSDKNVETMGCGRTDAGVHASCFYLHFDMDEIQDKKEFTFKLNCILPSSISVEDIFLLREGAHARFDAKSRTYHYFIHTNKNPFVNRFSTEFKQDLDLGLMNESCAILKEFIDFTSFSKSNTQTKTNNCRITHAKWVRTDKDNLRFEITADRFLRNMVRAIVGTMVEVGTGKMTLTEFKQAIESKDRGGTGTSMPPQGLFLANIEYEYIPDEKN